MSTQLDNQPVITEEVSELRCTAAHHLDRNDVEHECTIRAVAIFSCSCRTGYVYICQTNLDIVNAELAMNSLYCQCFLLVRECFRVTPL